MDTKQQALLRNIKDLLSIIVENGITVDDINTITLTATGTTNLADTTTTTLGFTTADGTSMILTGGVTTVGANITLATYADDAAAGVGGLVTGDFYKTATGEVRIKL